MSITRSNAGHEAAPMSHLRRSSSSACRPNRIAPSKSQQMQPLRRSCENLYSKLGRVIHCVPCRSDEFVSGVNAKLNMDCIGLIAACCRCVLPRREECSDASALSYSSSFETVVSKLLKSSSMRLRCLFQPVLIWLMRVIVFPRWSWSVICTRDNTESCAQLSSRACH